jgi:hypothetical protein
MELEAMYKCIHLVLPSTTLKVKIKKRILTFLGLLILLVKKNLLLYLLKEKRV